MVVRQRHLNTGTKTQASSRQHARNLGLSSDEAGHVLANKLGGSGTEKQNLVPLHPTTNKKQYHKVEKVIAEAVRKHGRGQYYLKYMYDSEDDTRPHTIWYSYSYDRVAVEGSLPNPE